MKINSLFLLWPCLASDGVLPDERIINGTAAEEGQFPFFVGLTLHEDSYRCGGTLLDPRTVLTAAHCLYDIDTENLTAHIGAMHRNPMVATESILVSEIMIHPNFIKFDGLWDIAILKLEHDASSKDFVAVDPNFIDVGTELVAVGMGLDVNNDEVYELRYTTAEVMPWEEYCDFFPSPYPSSNFHPEMQLCLSSSTNTGDSGGPYLSQINGTYYQVGITSRNVVSFEQVTRLSFYSEWIQGHME